MIGQSFGDWQVLSKGSRPGFFLCRCICGKEKDVWSSTLGRRSNGCGCRKGEKIKLKLSRRSDPIRQGFTSLIARYRNGALSRGLSWSIDPESFHSLSTANCHYCGSLPSRLSHDFNYNGLDRKDSSKGYELDNVVPCCWTCNAMKRTISYEDFLNHIRKIAANHPSQGSQYIGPQQRNN